MTRREVTRVSMVIINRLNVWVVFGGEGREIWNESKPVLSLQNSGKTNIIYHSYNLVSSSPPHLPPWKSLARTREQKWGSKQGGLWKLTKGAQTWGFRKSARHRTCQVDFVVPWMIYDGFMCVMSASPRNFFRVQHFSPKNSNVHMCTYVQSSFNKVNAMWFHDVFFAPDSFLQGGLSSFLLLNLRI